MVHPRSGTFLRTDRLGARAVRVLVAGGSDVQAMAAVERIEAGAGERAGRLIFGLEMLDAMTPEQPQRGGPRWWAKQLAAKAIGWTLSVSGRLTPLVPVSLLAWGLRILPSSPIGRHVWRAHRYDIIHQLRLSGYAERSEAWLDETSRACAASSPINWCFMYMSLALTPRRLSLLVERLVDRDTTDELADVLCAVGPAVVVFLHGSLYLATPNALRARGIEMIRPTVTQAHGVNVSQGSDQLRYFGEPADLVVDTSDPLATQVLLGHLAAGRSVHIALDRTAGAPTAAIELLGRRFARNDGPAGLAVESGRPVIAINTYVTPSGTVAIKTNPPLHPDASLAPEQRVADLSSRLYACAEVDIREHPEAWAGWKTLPALLADRRLSHSLPAAPLPD